MRITISAQKGFYIIINLAIALIIIPIQNMAALAWLSIFQVLWGIYCFYKTGGEWITIESIFLTLSFVFHMGDIIPSAIFNNTDITVYIYNRDLVPMNDHLVMESVKVLLYCHASFVIGCLLAFSNRQLSNFRIRITKIKWLKSCDEFFIYRLGLFIAIIGFLPRLYLDYKIILARLTGGYAATYEVSKRGIGWIAALFYLGIQLMVYASRDNKRRAIFLIAICSVAQVVNMLSGNRIQALAFIISLLIIYYKRIQKIKIGTIIKAFIALYFVSAILATITRSRDLDFSMSGIIILFGEMLLSNPILLIFGELGRTMVSLVQSLRVFPDLHHFGYGISYFEALVSWIPRVSMLFNENDMVFVNYFPNRKLLPLGGSWLGEAFFNFGWYSFIFTFFVGIIITRFDNTLSSQSQSDDYSGVLFVIPLIMPIIVYVRDYINGFASSIRQVIILCLFAYLYSKFISNKEAFEIQ